MNSTRWNRLACVTLLAGLALAAATSPLRATEPAAEAIRGGGEALPADTTFVPRDCRCFVTFRVGDLLGKLAGQEIEKLIPLADLSLHLGVPLADLERLTCVATSKPGKGVTFLQSAKPLPRKAILEACVPGAEEIKHMGTVLHVRKSDGQTIHFVNDRFLIGGHQEAVLECLTWASSKPTPLPESLADALGQAGKHDIVAWGIDSLMAEQAKLARIGIESGMLTLDVGNEFTVGLRLNCADEAKARLVGKGLRGILTLIRGQVLAVTGLPDAECLIPDTLPKELCSMPMKLLRLTEKGLQEAVVQPEGTTVTMSLTIAANTRTLCKGIAGIARAMGSSDSGPCAFPVLVPLGFQTYEPGLTLPSPQYVQNPPCPLATPPVQVWPATGMLAQPMLASTPRGPVGYPAALPMMACQSTGTCSVPDPPIQPISVCPPPATGMQAPWSSSVAVPSMGPMTSAVNTVTVEVQGAPATVKLTVANVRKEPALLFEMEGAGKMTFVTKLAPGEATDVKASSSKRWVAVFPDMKAGETYSAPQADAVWLLR
jgi:hypothetical protein